MKDIQVRKITGGFELEQVYDIRRKVFVEEQDCPPELEWEYEDESAHFLGTVDGLPAAAARWRLTDKGYKLERFAVLKEFRGMGVGQVMVRAVLEDLPGDAGYVYLNAQLPAMGLYARFGFVREGEQFEEAGIQHYKMVRQPS